MQVDIIQSSHGPYGIETLSPYGIFTYIYHKKSTVHVGKWFYYAWILWFPRLLDNNNLPRFFPLEKPSSWCFHDHESMHPIRDPAGLLDAARHRSPSASLSCLVCWEWRRFGLPNLVGIRFSRYASLDMILEWRLFRANSLFTRGKKNKERHWSGWIGRIYVLQASHFFNCMISWATVILNGFDIFSRCRVQLFAHEAFQDSIRHFPNGWSNIAWKKSSLLIPRSLNKIIKHGTVKVKMFSQTFLLTPKS